MQGSTPVAPTHVPVCRASSTTSARSASLVSSMRQPSKKNDERPALASADRCQSRSRAAITALLGLGFGDRFEGFRGGSGFFGEGVQQAEKSAELQGVTCSPPALTG